MNDKTQGCTVRDFILSCQPSEPKTLEEWVKGEMSLTVNDFSRLENKELPPADNKTIVWGFCVFLFFRCHASLKKWLKKAEAENICLTTQDEAAIEQAFSDLRQELPIGSESGDDNWEANWQPIYEAFHRLP